MVWILVLAFLGAIAISVYREIKKTREKNAEFDNYVPKPKTPRVLRHSNVPVVKDSKTPKPLKSKFFFAWGRVYDFEVVGESNYQEKLRSIAGKEEEKSKFIEEVACLEREPANRFDQNAVAIKIQGMTVAYLSKSDAKTFAKTLKNNEIDEYGSIYVRAIIVGGWKKGASSGSFGVKLDMPEYSKLKYCVSKTSFDRADEKLKEIPLSSQQKEQLKILNLKTSGEVTFFSFTNYINNQISDIKKNNPELYSKWLAYSEELKLKTEIYEFWGDKDELEIFDIKKPSKSELNKTIDELIKQGRSLDEIVDDPELIFEILIENNPSLEK